jgi:hypothetical protein
VDPLTSKRPCGRDHWVVEVEIQGVFDTIEHAWRIRSVATWLAMRYATPSRLSGPPRALGNTGASGYPCCSRYHARNALIAS